VSGSIYLPIELYELSKGISWLKIIFVLINLLIVLYMAMMLKRNGDEYLSKKMLMLLKKRVKESIKIQSIPADFVCELAF